MKMFVPSLAAAAVLFASSPALAHNDLFTSVTTNVFSPDVFQGMGGGFAQDFESFSVGPLVPQGGWQSQFPNNASITEINPISGARSARHASDGTGVPGFELNSPEFGNSHNPVSATVNISGTGSTYQLVTRDLTFGTFNTRVSFDTDGRIRVGQYSTDPFEGDMFEFIDTGVDWAINTDYTVTIDTDEMGNLFVSLDGSQIFAGIEGTFGLFQFPGMSGQLFVFAGNEGSGSADGTGDTLTIDNVNNIPAPAATALLTLAGLASSRRRR